MQGTILLAARVGAGRVLAVAGKEEQALDPISKRNGVVFSQTDNHVPFSLIKISRFASFLTCLLAAGVRAGRAGAFSFRRSQDVGSSC